MKGIHANKFFFFYVLALSSVSFQFKRDFDMFDEVLQYCTVTDCASCSVSFIQESVVTLQYPVH